MQSEQDADALLRISVYSCTADGVRFINQIRTTCSLFIYGLEKRHEKRVLVGMVFIPLEIFFMSGVV